VSEQSPTLEEIGSARTISVDPATPMSQAVKLMDENRISCLVITENRLPLGILTERDLVRLIAREPALGGAPVCTFMSKPPIVAAKGMPYLEGYHLCAEHGVRHLILVDDTGLLAGIVTETDFMDHLGLDAYVELKPVSSVMTRRPLTVAEVSPLGDAWALMSQNEISCVIVEREGKPVGILSERDLVHLSQSQAPYEERPVGEVMSAPVITVRPDETLHQAANIMRTRRIRRLAVVDEGGVLEGVVTGHDVVKGLESRYTTFLRQVIARQGKELTRTKERLNESLVLENILRASFNMAILATDMERRVRYFNPAAQSIFGVSRQHAAGRSLDSLYRSARFDPEHLEKGTAMAGRGGDYEFEIEPSAKQPRVLQCRIAPIKDREDQIQGYVHTLTDITSARRAEEEQRRLQVELLQARKMEAIGQLTGGIAHDFNNILGSVLGYSRLAADCLGTPDAHKVPGYLTEVYKAGKRAQDLVRQLLTFSRSSPQHPKHLDLVVLIKEVTKMLRATLPTTMTLRLELDRGVPAVHLDPIQVQQLLMNLVLNARDAIEGHGVISVGLRYLRNLDGLVSSLAHRPIVGDWVEMSVTDTGAGMSSDILERIFEPFFTTKEIGRGSGMGLAVVHGIVTQNEGEILVDSTPGRGARFRVLFRPSASGSSASALPHPILGQSPRVGINGVRILIADDDASIAGFMADLLDRAGYAVTVATNGQEALELFQQTPEAFDLVIADQVMPKLTGLELASRLHGHNPGLPVVLATGFGDLLSQEKLPKTGPKAILTKPVEPEDLLEAIEGLLMADSGAD